MNCVELKDDIAIYELEEMYFLSRYILKKRESLNNEIEWELAEYEKIHLDSKKRKLYISSILSDDKMYKYYDISLYGLLSRRILINKNGQILYDYIVDSILNGVKPNVYYAYGKKSIYYENLKPGQDLIQYLLQEHIFTNEKNSSDIFENRWLKDEFLLEYIGTERVFKDKQWFYFPSQQDIKELLKKK